MMADDIEGPNGLAFSPDETILYVVASRATPNRLIRAFDVADGGTQADQQPRLHQRRGRHAGRVPRRYRWQPVVRLGHGRRRTGRRAGVRRGGTADRPHRPAGACANLCFGGRFRNRLFMAASHGLYALYVNTQGVAGG